MSSNCVEYEGGLTICYGPPTKILKREDAGVKWCFKDRKRVAHEWQVIGYTEPSYYEPYWICVCSLCGQDHTAFPQ